MATHTECYNRIDSLLMITTLIGSVKWPCGFECRWGSRSSQQLTWAEDESWSAGHRIICNLMLNVVELVNCCCCCSQTKERKRERMRGSEIQARNLRVFLGRFTSNHAAGSALLLSMREKEESVWVFLSLSLLNLLSPLSVRSACCLIQSSVTSVTSSFFLQPILPSWYFAAATILVLLAQQHSGCNHVRSSLNRWRSLPWVSLLHTKLHHRFQMEFLSPHLSLSLSLSSLEHNSLPSSHQPHHQNTKKFVKPDFSSWSWSFSSSFPATKSFLHTNS